MSERVLANPLSGQEVIEAIIDKIRISLRRDCFLSPNLAYDYFSAKIRIELSCHDVGRKAEVTQEIVETQGEVNLEDEALNESDHSFEINPAPPNEVRVETGQDVPVLSRGTDGKPEIKGIKYSRKKVEKANA
jgi:hypothetical protein